MIVGYGSTTGVTTSDEVLGISVPMATAIADAAAARREYLDETGGRYVHVLADGDITPRATWPNHRLRRRRGGARHRRWRCRRRRWPAAGSGPSPRLTRRCRAVRCSGRARRAAVAGPGAQRPVRRSVRLAQPRRRPAPVDGQSGYRDLKGIPEGRTDGRPLSLGSREHRSGVTLAASGRWSDGTGLRRTDHRFGVRRQRQRAAPHRKGLQGRRSGGRPEIRRPRVRQDLMAAAGIPVGPGSAATASSASTCCAT